jgi:alpha-glucosidase
MLFLTLPGTPIFYAGEELGMAGGAINTEPVLDPFERLVPGYGLNRDPERSPMQWDGSRNSGFTRGTPWLPVAGDYRECNYAVECGNPRSILNLYRRLIALRRDEPVLASGRYATVLMRSEIMAYMRSDASRRLMIVLNFSARAQICSVPRAAGGRILVSTYRDRDNEIVSARISLSGNEGLVIALENPQQ